MTVTDIGVEHCAVPLHPLLKENVDVFTRLFSFEGSLLVELSEAFNEKEERAARFETEAMK